MLTVFWHPHGYLLYKKLPAGVHFTADYFITEILEPIYEMTTRLREESGKKMVLHFDNAKPHTSRIFGIS